MAYVAGGAIQAIDFNTFVTEINQVFADPNPGSIVAPPADFGYGHPALALVNIGQNIGAAEWTMLFDTIKKLGTHQGSVLDTSGIPALVNAGNIVAVITILSQVINNARSSRLSIDASQVAMIPLFTPSQPSYSTPAWTTGIELTYTVDFGTWDAARHYFNLGGSIGISASIPTGAPGTANRFWNEVLTDMGVVRMNSTSTLSNTVSTGTLGFYDLNTTYQEILSYTPSSSSLYYSGSFVSLKARFNATAGTSGVIQFVLGLYDGDPLPDPKTGPLTISVNNFQPSGVIPYLGTVTAATVGANGGFALASWPGPADPPLTLQVSPASLSGAISGAGTANAGPVEIAVLSGAAPYTFNWSNLTASPNNVSISAPINTATTSRVSIDKNMANGDTFTGTIRCTVTDAILRSASINVNWSLTSTGL